MFVATVTNVVSCVVSLRSFSLTKHSFIITSDTFNTFNTLTKLIGKLNILLLLKILTTIRLFQDVI